MQQQTSPLANSGLEINQVGSEKGKKKFRLLPETEEQEAPEETEDSKVGDSGGNGLTKKILRYLSGKVPE